jgi:deoxyribodipyrimidine photolyase-related protein
MSDLTKLDIDTESRGGCCRVILHDQLCHDIASLSDINCGKDTIVMFETMDVFTAVKHHKKKISFIISAMRHFAVELSEKGYNLIYIELDDPENSQTIITEIERVSNTIKSEKIITTWPGDQLTLMQLSRFKDISRLPVEIREDMRFLVTQEEFANWAKPRKELRMEFFYRTMRKKYEVLLEGENPVGGKWNFDIENRKFPKKALSIPSEFSIEPDSLSQEVIDLVSVKFSDHFGDILPFYFAVTHKQALAALDLFIETRLAQFGDYQDVMLQDEPWMYHSHLSFYINIGMLSPLACIQQAEKAYHNGKVSLNSAEGFIRQILGWREYIRGIYWYAMPKYKDFNYFNASRSLPDFFWTTKTKMNCLKQCITETKVNAYAHHIQRLMVLGNFALLAGLSPIEVSEWYLIVYADAYEWVELPNVMGMILYADGGFLASKPYAASGAYINKMSNYF